MYVDEFTIVCTGRGSHKKRELRQLTFIGRGVREAASLDFEWSDWQLSPKRVRGTATGRTHVVTPRQPAERGDKSKPWKFGCSECSRLARRSAEHMQYRISDSNLEAVVRAYLAIDLFELDISAWKQ